MNINPVFIPIHIYIYLIVIYQTYININSDTGSSFLIFNPSDNRLIGKLHVVFIDDFYALVARLYQEASDGFLYSCAIDEHFWLGGATIVRLPTSEPLLVACEPVLRRS